MSEPAELAAGSGRLVPESAAEELSRQLGLGPKAAQRLIAAGHTRADAVRSLSDGSLRDAGLDADDIQRIRASGSNGGSGAEAAIASPRPKVSGEQIVDRWMDSVRKAERPKRRTVAVPMKDSTDVLRKWVEGDDRAMEQWISSSEAARPAGPTRPTSETSAIPPAPELPPTTPAGSPAAPSALPAQLVEREETVVRWLTDLLDRVKTEQFDPHSILQEVQDTQRQLFEERARRKQLEDEIEHVKRGSIAVIKYVRNREAKAREQALQAKEAELADLKLKLLQGGASVDASGQLVAGDPSSADPSAPQPMADAPSRDLDHKLRQEFAEREQAYIDRETELRRRTVQLEADIRSLRAGAEAVRSREDLLKQGKESLSDTLNQRIADVDQRERDLLARENELRAKFEEIRIGAEDLERKRGPLDFKEKELAAWEQQLQMNKQALSIEARRLEQLRVAVAPANEASIKEKATDDLRGEVTRKEEELRAREAFLRQKMTELEALQRKAAEWEADQMHTEAVESTREGKVRTGVRRLDDLLYGGYPTGSQLLVNGPTHTGKDILARLFVAEGLKEGVPAIWIVTDRTYTQIREEMTLLYPPYAQAEGRGMLRYVDLYSRSLGVTQAEPSVRLLAPTDKGAVDQLTAYTNQFSQDLKEKFGGYRLVFESVSTVTAYLDTNTTFRFLQPFVGRRKMDGAAGYYILETGMHTDADLQTLEHMMDGSVNLKIDQLKTFLSVKGIGDSQSRAWVGYTFSKKSFSLGSFSLDHIR